MSAPDQRRTRFQETLSKGGPEVPPQGKSDSGLWPATDWSGLGRVAKSSHRDLERLNDLLVRYQGPLKVYLVSTFPGHKEEAEEILQDFSQDRILREGWLAKADPARGRFRHFLKTSLRNYVNDRLRTQANQPLSLEEIEVDPAAEEEASSAFDLDWARLILAEVLRRMEADCNDPGEDQPQRHRIWEVFRFRLLLPALEGSDPMAYETLVMRTGIVSAIEAQNLLATAKRIFARHLRKVIAEYEREGGAARTELAEMKSFLATCAERRRP